MTIEFNEQDQHTTIDPPSESQGEAVLPPGVIEEMPQPVPYSGDPVPIPTPQIPVVKAFLRRAGFQRVLPDKLRLGLPCAENAEHNITLGYPAMTYSIQPASAQKCNLCTHEQRHAAPVLQNSVAAPRAESPGLVQELVAAVVAGDIEIDHLERYPELDRICSVASIAARAGIRRAQNNGA